MSYYKRDYLQPSDFDRLFSDVSPFLSAAQGDPKQAYKDTLGGSLVYVSTRDWKLSAISQIGLKLSKLFSKNKEAFQDASQGTERVNFAMFKQFVEKHNLLAGFNISTPLLYQLFAELDPHKKTYLSYKDWQSAFSVFSNS